MNAVTTAELTRIKTGMGETMLDTCQIGVATEVTTGTYAVETITYGATIACGFNALIKQGQGATESREGAQASTNEAVVRLPMTTAVKGADRVKIITKAGVTLTPSPVYRILGGPQYGLSNILLRVMEIPAGGIG